jgi:hypothetical protein
LTFGLLCILFQNEYFVWIGHNWYKGYGKRFDADQMIAEYDEWMRDNWNHPSVVIWDANDETWYPDFATKIIPAVRSLDLSHRAWENSYNGPMGPDDPVEDHPYEHHVSTSGGDFEMTELESRSGVFTCDHFRDLERLELEPQFEDYVSQAFRRLGVYLNFWHPTVEAGSKQKFTVMMVNDDGRPLTGDLALVIENQKGETLARHTVPFSLAAQQTYFVDLTIPMPAERCLLKAIARPKGGAEPTLSRWRVDLMAGSAPK